MEGSFQQATAMGAAGGAEAAWRGLAALVDWRGGRPTGEQLAQHLSAHKAAIQSSLAIRNFLHEILVHAGGDAGAVRIQADVSQLIEHLPLELLPSVLRTEVDEHRRTEFLTAVTQRLSLPAVLRFASGLSAAFDRPFPEPVRALLRTAAHRALSMPAKARAEVETLLRDQLRRQFVTWTSRPRTSQGGYEPVVEKVERRPPGRTTPEADRLLEMAIESDGLGPAVWIALHEVVEDGGVARVIDVMKTAPEESAAGASIMRRIGTPQELRSLLRAEPLDGAAVDALLRGMGIAAASVLLEELVESQARLTRRYLMERLARFGTEIRPLVEGRLRDSRWFVQRNMLALLRAAKCPADLALASKFMGHKDVRVRREAVLWCLDNGATRDEALASALADRDASVLRPALQSARGHLPGSAIPVLSKRLVEPDFPPEFRVLAISLLGRAGSVLALEALLHFAQNGRTLLGKPKLAGKSAEMIAAISALARSWPTERRAAALLEQAKKSRDTDVAAAVAEPATEAAA